MQIHQVEVVVDRPEHGEHGNKICIYLIEMITSARPHRAARRHFCRFLISSRRLEWLVRFPSLRRRLSEVWVRLSAVGGRVFAAEDRVPHIRVAVVPFRIPPPSFKLWTCVFNGQISHRTLSEWYLSTGGDVMVLLPALSRSTQRISPRNCFLVPATTRIAGIAVKRAIVSLLVDFQWMWQILRLEKPNSTNRKIEVRNWAHSVWDGTRSNRNHESQWNRRFQRFRNIIWRSIRFFRFRKWLWRY